MRPAKTVIWKRAGILYGVCALCGAAAESILLTVAIAKSGDEDGTLKAYRGTHGRRKITVEVVNDLAASIAAPFRSATGLPSYWRDQAAHGPTFAL